jgi:primosomal protein N' (replication factor Y)
MGNPPKFADVILPLPVKDTFTYKVSNDQSGKIRPGLRVTVQFGRRKIYTALVSRVHNIKPAGYEVKDILSILDDIPLVNDIQLKFWEWIAEYYMCSIGEVYKAALPAGLKLESETKVFPVSGFNKNIKLSETEILVLNALQKQNVLNVKEIASLTDKRNVMQILRSMFDKGVILLEERLKAGYKPRKQSYVRINPEINNEKDLNKILGLLEKAPRQLELLTAFLDLSNLYEKSSPDEVEKLILLNNTGCVSSTLNSLVKKGILETYEKEVSRLTEIARNLREPFSLNSHQKKTLSQIKTGFLNQDVVLLHGVTSSGKTEIYIHLISEQLRKGNQVLYLLPEIALTAQIINRLKNIFGEKAAVYHSKFSDNERIEIWENIIEKTTHREKRCQVILGARSSLFLPFNKLGLIIIDEEHENTYKQSDSAPRYHARDTAIMLARFHGAKVLLGTATPSIESFYNTITGKYGLAELKIRYLELKMPEIKIVDVRKARLKKEMQSLFSTVLLNSVKNALENKEQAILFQNRRGFSPYIQCNECAWIPFCVHCDVSMTYHKHLNKIICHYCGYATKVPESCNICGSRSILTQGFGTEKIEDEIHIFFPEARVKRMDLDSTRTRKSYEQIISDFETGNIDILVGTQMITKGLDFNNVRVVGILNADNMLNFPDFRSYERSYQLMSQVSGRAGRKSERGLVIIQTSDPENIIIQNVKNNDYHSMFKSQLNERKKFKYPPFYRLIEITLKHKKKHILDNASNSLAYNLRKKFSEGILGPEPPVINKIQDWHIKKILFKLEKEKSVGHSKKIIKKLIDALLSRDEFKSLQIIVDVDPL